MSEYGFEMMLIGIAIGVILDGLLVDWVDRMYERRRK